MPIRSLLASAGSRYLLIGTTLTMLAMGASQALYGPFYSHFRGLFDLTASEVGALASFNFVGSTVAVIAGSKLVNRFGFRPVILVAGTVFTAGFVIVAAATSWLMVRTGVLCIGIGFGGLVSLNFLIDEAFGEFGAAALSFTNSGFSVGAIMAPVIAGVSLAFGGHRIAFSVGAILAISAVVFALGMERRNAIVETRERSWGRALAGTVVFWLLYALYVGSEASAAHWIPTNLELTFSGTWAAAITTVFWISFTIGRLAAVPFSMRIRPGRLLIGATLLGVLSALLAGVPGLAPVGFALTGFFIGPVFPVGLSWIRRTFPARASSISAVVIAGGGVGGIFLPPTVGAVVDAHGAAAIPHALAGIIGAAALVCILIAVIFSTGTVSAASQSQQRSAERLVLAEHLEQTDAKSE